MRVALAGIRSTHASRAVGRGGTARDVLALGSATSPHGHTHWHAQSPGAGAGDGESPFAPPIAAAAYWTASTTDALAPARTPDPAGAPLETPRRPPYPLDSAAASARPSAPDRISGRASESSTSAAAARRRTVNRVRVTGMQVPSRYALMRVAERAWCVDATNG